MEKVKSTLGKFLSTHSAMVDIGKLDCDDGDVTYGITKSIVGLHEAVEEVERLERIELQAMCEPAPGGAGVARTKKGEPVWKDGFSYPQFMEARLHNILSREFEVYIHKEKISAVIEAIPDAGEDLLARAFMCWVDDVDERPSKSAGAKPKEKPAEEAPEPAESEAAPERPRRRVTKKEE